MKSEKSTLRRVCRNGWFTSLAVALFSFVGATSGQVVTIHFDDVPLLFNTANQPVDLFVQVSVADFTDVTGIASETESTDANGPTISNVDLFTAGSLFASGNTGAGGAGSITPRIFERGTTLSSGSITIPIGTWKYGTVYFDTTGVPAGNYGYTPDTQNNPTLFHTSFGDRTPGVNISGALIAGTLTVVPEPSTYAVISGIGCLAVGALVRRARGK
jgi:hypothetical protein